VHCLGVAEPRLNSGIGLAETWEYLALCYHAGGAGQG